jgi:spermidine/putrescine-binding protein
VKALETMKAAIAYMDPEVLTADSTYVQQQFQQGKIAMANLWSSRAGAMDNPEESQVVGKVKLAAAPMAGDRPASTLWWDGIVIAKNISDAEAEAAFRVALEGIDAEMANANPAAAIWIVPGYAPGALAVGAAATAEKGAVAFPASTQMGLMQTALQNALPAFLTGQADAATTLRTAEEAYVSAAKEAGLLK